MDGREYSNRAVNLQFREVGMPPGIAPVVFSCFRQCPRLFLYGDSVDGDIPNGAEDGDTLDSNDRVTTVVS
jgi:hypothetical protein